MTAIYSEWDPYAAQWTRNLIAAGHVAPGVVDERSITELRATDLLGDGQRHFFAGVAIWSHALRLAGWPDDRAVWTGSCPCQPFSAAGKRGGFVDDRHLWPVWFDLIRKCRPDVILGEQVSSPDGLMWFDAVSADMEREGYAVGALDTCAAGVGAPHIRQRLYWVAHAGSERRAGVGVRVRGRGPHEDRAQADRRGEDRERVGDSVGIDAWRDARATPRTEATSSRSRGIDRDLGDVARAPGNDCVRLGDASSSGPQGRVTESSRTHRLLARAPGVDRWDDVEWLDCTDGKRRPVEPGLEPLAPRSPSHVGRLRAYGNGLNVAQAATFIRAVMEAM